MPRLTLMLAGLLAVGMFSHGVAYPVGKVRPPVRSSSRITDLSNEYARFFPLTAVRQNFPACAAAPAFLSCAQSCQTNPSSCNRSDCCGRIDNSVTSICTSDCCVAIDANGNPASATRCTGQATASTTTAAPSLTTVAASASTSASAPSPTTVAPAPISASAATGATTSPSTTDVSGAAAAGTASPSTSPSGTTSPSTTSPAAVTTASALGVTTSATDATTSATDTATTATDTTTAATDTTTAATDTTTAATDTTTPATDTTTATADTTTASEPSTTTARLTPSPAPDSSSKSCFPVNARVELESGASKRMEELEIGDRIKVAHGRYSEIFMFTHKDPLVRTSFVSIRTISDHTITLSPGHYLYLNGALVLASAVKTGDEVMLGDGSVSHVAAATYTEATGLFNPQTLHGDIVVDGVVASTYTTAVSPGFGHAWLAPMRTLYKVFGISGGTLVTGANYAASMLPDGPAVCR